MRLRPPARIPILAGIVLVLAACTAPAAGTSSPGGTRSPDATGSPVPSCPSAPPSGSPGGSPGPATGPCVLGAIESPGTSPPASDTLGKVWHGTLTLHTFREYDPLHPGKMTCEDDWTADFALIVAADATATGTGVATLTAGPTCTFPITGFGHRIEFTTEGAAFSDRLQFRTTLTFVERPGDWAGFQVSLFTVTGGPGPIVTAQITDSRTALGPVSLTGEISGQPTTATGTVELSCTNC